MMNMNTNDKKRAGFVTVKVFSKSHNIHFTNHDDGGKLAGYRSLSTSCLQRALCRPH